jgi:hypothetical protein
MPTISSAAIAGKQRGRLLLIERVMLPDGRDKLFDYAAEDALLREMGVAPGA